MEDKTTGSSLEKFINKLGKVQKNYKPKKQKEKKISIKKRK